MSTPCILVADDQPDVLEALKLLLKSERWAVVTASSPRGVLDAVVARDFEVALIDLNYARDTTSGREGFELLAQLAAADPTLPVVVMTAWGSIEGAVEAMKRGARDYVAKPWENARLLATLRTQAELARALRESRKLGALAARERDGVQVQPVAESPGMRAVLDLAARIGPSDANVLVTGEHGTGKEVLARYLHAVSNRRDGPFVAINAGGLADGVFESELFGHVKGAFTDAKADRVGCFELADGGTLFLDEIGNMPAGQQQKLLRVLQTGEFHPVGSSKTRIARPRVVSATNIDVLAEVAAGRFREDLLYRLNTVELPLPPLRERKEDVAALAQRFLRRTAQRYERLVHGFSPGALQALEEHAWPGNVRELEHLVERAVLLARGEELQVEDLQLRARPASAKLEDMTLEEVERTLVQRALARAGGKVADAARALGLSRSAMYRRMEQFGLKGSE
ncbi:MAG: sigma-54-dependent Fis family transcriptional regulator [Archangiaceae bacterium]|nr:sigma-54-dependent Fis family transcriptional regulator [Archangiaceae bacterium]